MMSLGQIELDLSDCANLEFHARTLYLFEIQIVCNSKVFIVTSDQFSMQKNK